MGKTKLLLVTAALIAAGCAEYPSFPGELMAFPLNNGSEVEAIVPVPVTKAYTNILSKARDCWQRENRVVEGDPFTPEDGFARVSLRIPAGFVHGNTFPTVIDVFPETGDRSRFIARSIHTQPSGLADLPSLALWAEGKDVPCR